MANACAFSVDVVVTEDTEVGKLALVWPPGPALGPCLAFWLGSTWIRVAFHLKGIFALYAASSNTRSCKSESGFRISRSLILKYLKINNNALRYTLHTTFSVSFLSRIRFDLIQ